MTNMYIVNSSDLETVADSIRAKTGGSEQLTFPTGFATAITSIKGESSYLAGTLESNDTGIYTITVEFIPRYIMFILTGIDTSYDDNVALSGYADFDNTNGVLISNNGGSVVGYAWNNEADAAIHDEGNTITIDVNAASLIPSSSGIYQYIIWGDNNS